MKLVAKYAKTGINRTIKVTNKVYVIRKNDKLNECVVRTKESRLKNRKIIKSCFEQKSKKLTKKCRLVKGIINMRDRAMSGKKMNEAIKNLIKANPINERGLTGNYNSSLSKVIDMYEMPAKGKKCMTTKTGLNWIEREYKKQASSSGASYICLLYTSPSPRDS